MVRRSASKRKAKRKETIADERLGDLDKVISGIEDLVAVRLNQRELVRRVGTFERNDTELRPEEIKRLPKAAEWATDLRDALDSGKVKRLNKV